MFHLNDWDRLFFFVVKSKKMCLTWVKAITFSLHLKNELINQFSNFLCCVMQIFPKSVKSRADHACDFFSIEIWWLERRIKKKIAAIAVWMHMIHKKKEFVCQSNSLSIALPSVLNSDGAMFSECFP